MTLSADQILDALEGLDYRLVGEAEEGLFPGFAVDSRRVRPGELFIALNSDPRLPQDEAEEALGRGAGGAVVPSGWSRKRSVPGGRLVIEVADPLRALIYMSGAGRRAAGLNLAEPPRLEARVA